MENADSGTVLFLESDFRSDFGAMTSRRLGAVATAYGVADSGTVVTSTRGSRDDLWRRRFWAILVRRWWSCAAVFHCDILNP